MRGHDDPIEDTLLVSCREFLHVASLTGNDENSLDTRFHAIYNMWVIRWKHSRDRNFPHIRSFIPLNQWEESCKIFRKQQIQFVGALADYLLDLQSEKGGV